jgi:hypothetical protein
MPLSKLKRYCDTHQLIEESVKKTYYARFTVPLVIPTDTNNEDHSYDFTYDYFPNPVNIPDKVGTTPDKVGTTPIREPERAITIDNIDFLKPIDIPVRESEIYAIMTNNVDYLSYLVNMGYEFNDVHVYIALANNKSHIVKQFYKTSNMLMLAKMAHASFKSPNSLKYVLSISDCKQIFDSISLVCYYYNTLTFGHIECVKMIYDILPKRYITNVFKQVWNTDELLDNIKYLHDQGYVLTADEFKMASSNNENENIETLKYLMSIGIEFTDEQLSEWKKHPKCADFLSNK